MTYKELITEAETYYRKMAAHSPFCAVCDAREYIASRFDLCEDRNEHLEVLRWDEYKKYAPMTKEQYKREKEYIENRYKRDLEELDKEYEERGKNSPDYHKF